jgi:hypothetical protein
MHRISNPKSAREAVLEQKNRAVTIKDERRCDVMGKGKREMSGAPAERVGCIYVCMSEY